MGGPEKPFSCPETGCGASFTNEDRLAVHSRKHDMVLQLGSKGGTFVADQTPTPTRFIRNCEEVGLFQDLQNVNPFDETFKRAMESRSEINHLSLNTHLSAPSADDTLHTPHIFPHISDDNSNNQYLCKADHQQNINVNQHSNDNISDQLSAEKCSSVVNVNSLHNINNQEKNVNDKSLLNTREDSHRKPVKYPRLKLIRQNSVELIENDHNPIILKRIDSTSMICEKLHSGMTLISNDNGKNNLKEKSDNLASINIPVINITDSSEKSMINENSDVNDRNTILKNDKCIDNKNSILLNTPDLERINMKILNKKSLELMSQSSIDMALVNFTNEVNERTMDLNNISIEDIPSLNGVPENTSTKLCIHPSNKQNLIETPIESVKVSNSPYSVIKDNILIMNESKKNDLLEKKLENSDKNMLRDRSPNHASPLNHIDTRSYSMSPVVENNKNEKHLDTNDNKGYELLLKWPDGKKVYLKEVFREEDVQLESTNPINDKQTLSELNIKDNSISMSGVKRKLKESLESSAKRNLNALSPNSNKINIPGCFNSSIISNELIIPHTFIVQKTNEIPYISNNIISNCNLIKSGEHLITENAMKQAQIKIKPKTDLLFNLGIAKNSNDLKTAVPVLLPKPCSIKNKKYINSLNTQNIVTSKPMRNLSEPITIQNPNNLVLPSEKVIQSNKSAIIPTLLTNKNIVKQNDSQLFEKNVFDLKRVDIQERNRAAVTRYRTRKKAQTNLICENNEKLEQENNDLKKRLNQALQENRRLRDILSLHTNCRINKNLQKTDKKRSP